MGEGGNLIVFYYFRASEIGVASLEGLGRGGRVLFSSILLSQYI
jgi:hypothetical protein